ncbi:MAG: NUDIX hydrolase [Aerococcus sp.]|nr:NUDIX hydrolase [Aerococcus sp.]
MEFGEKTVSKETIFEGNLLTLEKHDVKLQNGNLSQREIIRHGPAVAIIAINEGKIAMVRQYRKAIEKAILEIPAGLVDPDEDWDVAAKREFEEEVQLSADHWERLVGFYASPGYLDEYLQLYTAKGLHHVANPKAQDADEHLETVWLTGDECEEAIKSGEICDAKTIYAVSYMRQYLQ